MKISQLTRREFFDSMIAEKVNWCVRLEESEFLSRLFDLQSLPSTDSRFPNAAGDIWQHRVNKHDWEEDWVFHDSRFNLMNGDDEVFLHRSSSCSLRYDGGGEILPDVQPIS